MKTITFPREMDKTLKLGLIPTNKLGFFKPHQIYLVLDYKQRITHTYIQVISISRMPYENLPKFLKIPGLKPKIELLKFKVVYEDSYKETDEFGNTFTKIFN